MEAIPQSLVNLGREKRAGSRRPEPRVLRSVADLDEAIGFIAGQRAQQDGIDDGEHRAIGADAERKRDNRGHCECRATPQPASSNEQVRDHGLSASFQQFYAHGDYVRADC